MKIFLANILTLLLFAEHIKLYKISVNVDYYFIIDRITVGRN